LTSGFFFKISPDPRNPFLIGDFGDFALKQKFGKSSGQRNFNGCRAIYGIDWFKINE